MRFCRYGELCVSDCSLYSSRKRAHFTDLPHHVTSHLGWLNWKCSINSYHAHQTQKEATSKNMQLLISCYLLCWHLTCGIIWNMCRMKIKKQLTNVGFSGRLCACVCLMWLIFLMSMVDMYRCRLWWLVSWQRCLLLYWAGFLTGTSTSNTVFCSVPVAY